jgi:PHD/YefM family antitoxin component YafN of YafNO toxin-antitoxin module
MREPINRLFFVPLRQGERMVNVFEEKEKLVNILSDQYSRSIISLSDYESMIEQVNKIESARDLLAVQKIVGDSGDVSLYDELKHMTVFSERNVDVKPVNGRLGDFVSVFGETRVRVRDIPPGRTVLNAQAVFGSIEIFVPKNVRIINHVVPVMGGTFAPNDWQEDEGSYQPELHIYGAAVFGSITITRKQQK